MAEQIEIRRAKEEDLPQVIELWRELIEFHYRLNPVFELADDAEKTFENFLRQNLSDEDKSRIFVADKGDAIVGYCLAKIVPHPPVLKLDTVGEIYDMAVTEKSRRKGIGEALFCEAKKFFAENGIYHINVRVLETNPISTKFWPKMGFKTLMLSMAYSERLNDNE